ncbi:MAG: hypothetical protein HC803_02605 [Saprospiraceae bacterium]|nr:hypothetical protein [Saprospiraceae bacterium]
MKNDTAYFIPFQFETSETVTFMKAKLSDDGRLNGRLNGSLTISAKVIKFCAI